MNLRWIIPISFTENNGFLFDYERLYDKISIEKNITFTLMSQIITSISNNYNACLKKFGLFPWGSSLSIKISKHHQCFQNSCCLYRDKICLGIEITTIFISTVILVFTNEAVSCKVLPLLLGSSLSYVRIMSVNQHLSCWKRSICRS